MSCKRSPYLLLLFVFVITPCFAQLRHPHRHAPFDFDGDRITDIGILSRGSWYFSLSRSGYEAILFGETSDIPVPADFNGDGITDPVFYRPSTDTWYTGVGVHQGNRPGPDTGDQIPLPSDFDGDGKADFIIYHPSNSVWTRQGSTGENSTTVFGAVGDKAVIGDFDG